MNAPIYRPGFYCDVAVWIDGRLLNMTVEDALVRCYLENDVIWEQRADHALLFGRCAVQGNQFMTVHQGQPDGSPAWLIGNGLVRSLGPNFGAMPVGIDSHEAFVISAKGVYQRAGLVSQPFPFPLGVPPDSSQGISDVQPDGTLWFADVHRSVVIDGVTFTYPNVRGPVTVGQVDPPGIAAAVGGKVTRVIEGDAYEPHVAVSQTGRVAICARTAQGAAYVATTIDELKG